MWWFASIASAVAEDPRDVPAGEIAAVGDIIGYGRVVRVEVHSEYERYWVDSAGGTLPAELTTADPVHEGLCATHGLTIYPRYDLGSGKTDSIDLSPLCERLAASDARLRPRTGTPESPIQASAGAVGRYLGALAVVGLVAALTTIRRWTWRPIAIVVVALCVRLAVVSPGIFNGGGAGYEKLGIGLGWEWGTPYGPGFAVVMAPFVAVLGATPSSIFTGNLVVAALAPALLYVLVCRWARTDSPALAAAVALTLLPAHLALSRSEALHIPVTTLLLAALVAAPAGGAGGMAAVAATVAMVYTRPDALPLAVLPAALLWGNPSRFRLPFVGALVLGVLGRASTLPVSTAVLQPETLLDAETLTHALTPRIGMPEPERAFQLFLHAGFTPPAWWALALVGMVCAPRALRWLAIATIALGTGAVVTKVWPLADAIRLQLPAQVGWALLVGYGVYALRRWGWLLLLAGAAPYLWHAVPEYPQAREFRFLAETVPTLPADARIRFVSSASHAEKFRMVMESMGKARWSDSDEPSILYHGLACINDVSAPACVRTACPVAVETIVGVSDVDLPLPTGGFDVGFYRRCP